MNRDMDTRPIGTATAMTDVDDAGAGRPPVPLAAALEVGHLDRKTLYDKGMDMCE